MNNYQQYLVIGSGGIACRHIANIRKLYEKSEIFCVSSSGREINKKECGADHVIKNIEDLDLDSLDFVMGIIASPSPFHLRHAKTLLQVGIPVLIEKPLADTLLSFQEQHEFFFKMKSRFDVAYNLRFLPSALEFKRLITEKKIGKIHHVSVEVGQYLPDWRPHKYYQDSVSAQKSLGGGVLLELSHEIDYLAWIFGDFDSVYCVSSNSNTLNIDVEDKINAIFENEVNGLTAYLHMDFLQRSATRKCKVIGEYGTLEWDLFSNSIFLCGPKLKKENLFYGDNYDMNEMYRHEIIHFKHFIYDNAAPAVGIEHALKTLVIIEAMKLSSRLKKSISIRDICL